MKIATYLIACCCLIESAWAAPIYTCYRTQGPINVDGKIDEETWQLAEPMSPLRDLDGITPAHAEATIKLAYDDHYLYCSAVLPERTLRATLTQRDSIIYHDNDFEIFIDPTCTGRHYLELEINALNTVWDLLLTDAYRDGGVALHDWDIKGLRHAVSHQGTLNDDTDIDRSWSVEIAWPWRSITAHDSLPRTDRPPQAGQVMRFNFSRVDHPRDPTDPTTQLEKNSVWAPTAQSTIHTPELWGRVRFSDRVVGVQEPFPPEVCMWLHGGDEAITVDTLKPLMRYGLTTVLIDGSVEQVAAAAATAKSLNLRVIAWVWALNRPGDPIALRHPEWYAVSANGKSCHDPATRPFVAYYQFLCPNNPAAKAHVQSIVKAYAQLKDVDAIQLDYIRQPDVQLPKGLWAHYGLDMTTELDDYDFCYCDHCRALYTKASGKAPKKGDPQWADFRLQAVANFANALIDTAHQTAKPCGAAVFPNPQLASKMVRQDWSLFKLDFALPMVYASFYQADEQWILDQIRQSQKQTQHHLPLYPGIFLPDYPDKEPPKALIQKILEINPRGYALFK